MPLTAAKYDGLLTAMRQRLNGKRVGKYRRLSFDAIRYEIDTALFAPDVVPSGGDGQGRGESFGHVCDQCGACCRQLSIEVQQSDLDREPKLADAVQRIAQHIPTGTTEDGVIQLEANGEVTLQLALIHATPRDGDYPCPMLCEGRCSIHATKPKVCSDTPAGSFCCQYSRRQEGLPALPRGRAR